MVSMDDIKKFVNEYKNYIIAILVMVLVVLIILSILEYTNSRESFGKLQRVKLLAEAAHRAEMEKAANPESFNRGELINQQEQFNGPRTDMLFPGQFDYLTGKSTSAVSQQAKEQVAQQIAQPVVEQIKQAQQVQQNPSAQQVQQMNQPAQQMKRQVLQQVQQRIQPQAVQDQLQQLPAEEGQHTYLDGQMLDNQRDVQSNSGNSLQTPSAESFGHSRIYRQFNNLMGGIEASEEAQKSDQVQTTVEMKAMQQQLA